MTIFLKPALIAAATLLVACSPSTEIAPAATAIAAPEAAPAADAKPAEAAPAADAKPAEAAPAAK